MPKALRCSPHFYMFLILHSRVYNPFQIILHTSKFEHKRSSHPKTTEPLDELFGSFQMLAAGKNLHLDTSTKSITNETVFIDKQILYRILENAFGNALRYAKSMIKIDSLLKSISFHRYR